MPTRKSRRSRSRKGKGKSKKNKQSKRSRGGCWLGDMLWGGNDAILILNKVLQEEETRNISNISHNYNNMMVQTLRDFIAEESYFKNDNDKMMLIEIGQAR